MFAVPLWFVQLFSWFLHVSLWVVQLCRQTGSISKLMSTAGAECVSAPTDT